MTLADEVTYLLGIEGLCTEAQRRNLEAILEHGTQRKAAVGLDMAKSSIDKAIATVRKNASRLGHAPKAGLNHPVAPGFELLGYSHLSKTADGEPIWLKARVSKQQELHEDLRQFVEELLEPVRGLAPTIPPPTYSDASLLSVYPIGDQHHGMYADARETGANYDCTISAGLLTSAVDWLCSSAPDSETALLIDVGDFHHANDSKNETPGHGHRLDVDTRYGNVMRTGAMAFVACILRLLQKHKTVIVWIMPGNHNPDAAFAHALAISMYFHAEPRVSVCLDTSAFKFHRFGKNLIASHHGDGVKPEQLPLLMANDRKEDWAATEHRIWHCGHIHHKTFKEYPGVDVESHRTLAPGNSWDHKKGYRSKREMQRIDYHIENGEAMRTRCNAAMLQRP